MEKKVRVCKYGCNTQLVRSDDISGFVETKGGLPHTKVRCEQVKKESKQDTNGHNDISLELVLAKLRKIGVDINLDLLKNVPVPVNGNGK